jgi:hypothetical protein
MCQFDHVDDVEFENDNNFGGSDLSCHFVHVRSPGILQTKFSSVGGAHCGRMF